MEVANHNSRFRFEQLVVSSGSLRASGCIVPAFGSSSLRPEGPIVIKGKSYTFFIASTPGKLRKLVIPAYVLHGVAALALIGMITVTAAVGSYSRMLWKVGNYNAVRHELESTKQQYHQLQTSANDTRQHLDSLQSLATEVAMTYGVLRYHPAAFDVSDNPVTAADAFDRSVEQYTFLKKNAAAIAISSGGLRLMPSFSI